MLKSNVGTATLDNTIKSDAKFTVIDNTTSAPTMNKGKTLILGELRPINITRNKDGSAVLNSAEIVMYEKIFKLWRTNRADMSTMVRVT